MKGFISFNWNNIKIVHLFLRNFTLPTLTKQLLQKHKIVTLITLKKFASLIPYIFHRYFKYLLWLEYFMICFILWYNCREIIKKYQYIFNLQQLSHNACYFIYDFVDFLSFVVLMWEQLTKIKYSRTRLVLERIKWEHG